MQILAQILLFLVPFEHIPSWHVHGFTVRLSSLVVLAFVLSAAFLVKNKKQFFRISTLDRGIILYYVTVILSILVATDKKRAITVALLIAFMICAYLLISRTFRHHFDTEIISRTVMAAAFLTVLFGVYQFLGDAFGLSTHLTGLLPNYTKAIFGFPRIQSVGIEPLYYADYLLLPLFILVYRVMIIKDYLTLRDSFFLTLLLTVFILTISRGAYLASLGGFLVLLAYFIYLHGLDRVGLLSLGRLVIIFLIASTLAYAGIKSFSGNKGTTNFAHLATASKETRSASVDPRLESYKEAADFFLSKPILGIGIGNYGVLTKNPPCINCGLYAIVNNQYLETLAETGILGFIALVGVGVIVLKKLIWMSFKERQKGLAVVLLATFVGMIIQYNFFSTIYFLPLWVLLGLIEALPTKENR